MIAGHDGKLSVRIGEWHFANPQPIKCELH